MDSILIQGLKCWVWNFSQISIKLKSHDKNVKFSYYITINFKKKSLAKSNITQLAYKCVSNYEVYSLNSWQCY